MVNAFSIGEYLEMRVRLAFTSLMFMLSTSVFSAAMARGGRHSAPEIDGPGGIAAIALLVSAGLIAYNRYRRK
jgi:hypothetical protein